VTGATGFIGSHLARLLLREGCTVYALVRDRSNTRRIEDILSSLQIVQGDLNSLDGVASHLESIQPEICFHLAWCAEPGKYLTSQENLKLLIASVHLASRLATLGCKKFISAGTCFEYDTDMGCLSETSPTKPNSLYAASKLALKLLLEQLFISPEMRVAWLRFFYLYGPFEDERRLVPSVISSLLQNQQAKVTKGQQVRDFLHVEDVAAAIWAIAQSNLSGPVNIGSAKPVTVQEICECIGNIMNRSELIKFGALPYDPRDPMFICANNRRLVEKTGWVSHYDLREGLKHTIAWWKTYLQSAGRRHKEV
jgi:nucleoside-diphosphate-sugar epimerase